MLKKESFVGRQRVFSHRTGGFLAPENSLAGLKHARNLGFQNIQFDVRLTADGVPILKSDESIHTTETSSILVSEVFFDQINGLDIGIDYGNEYIGEKLPTLYQAFSACTELAIRPIVELKPSIGQERSIAEISIDILNRVGQDKLLFPLVISENVSTLATLMNIAPEISRGLIWNNNLIDEPDDHEALKFQCVMIPLQLISSQLIEALHRKQHSVVATNINDSVDAITAVEHKIDALVTGQIDSIGPYFF
ncbi:glycerophosphodiester phosphodiesterase family protein [Burkholderiales bacterium]|nr:glycerophosphodiester phosphodiesterase family protein [Burkholderiales bacterium]